MPLCFVYGTLKKGQHNHHLLKGATFQGTYTLNFNARMFDVGFPVIVDAQTPLRIEGEVYEVDTDTFARLDRLEGNGRMYQRRRKRLGDGRRAWCYIGKEEYWAGDRGGYPVRPQADGVIRWRNGQ